MNNHREPEKRRQKIVLVKDIEDDPVVKGARRLYFRQLDSRVSGFQKERSENNGNKRGQVVVLGDIAQGTPDRVAKKGNSDDRNYTVTRKYFYKKYNLSFLIPKDAEIVEVPAHSGGNTRHFRIQFGSILVHIYSEQVPELGEYIEGLADVKVSKSQRPNMGSGEKFYLYLNFYLGYGDETESSFFARFDQTRREVPEGSIDFSPSNRMIMHLDPME